MSNTLRILSETLARLARSLRATEPVARVFVYGTLKRGERAARLLESSRFEGTATLRGFRLYAGRAFPAIRREAGTVRGETYRVDRRTLRALDRYEGAPALYTRERVTVRLDSGACVDGFAYTMGRAPFPQWVPMGPTWTPGEGYRVRLVAARSLTARDALRPAFDSAEYGRALDRYMAETAPERERAYARHAETDRLRAADAARVALQDARDWFGALPNDSRPADLSEAWDRWERADSRADDDDETDDASETADAYAWNDDAPARVRADIERGNRADSALQDAYGNQWGETERARRGARDIDSRDDDARDAYGNLWGDID